jgi:hypothetical protein
MIELVNQKLPKDQQIQYVSGKDEKDSCIVSGALFQRGHLAKWELGVEVTGLVWLGGEPLWVVAAED